ncbi:hypothetical protein ACOMHN_033752 [Nucella lapillus]
MPTVHHCYANSPPLNPTAHHYHANNPPLNPIAHNYAPSQHYTGQGQLRARNKQIPGTKGVDSVSRHSLMGQRVPIPDTTRGEQPSLSALASAMRLLGRRAERKAGVGFAIRTPLIYQLESQPQGINDRIMTLRLPLSDNAYATMKRGTADMIFAARQIQEKCKEQNMDLYILFIDLTKAFDTVSRPGLWNIIPRIGIPPKMVKIIRCFHDGMNTRLVNGSENDEFPVTNGVKQGCVLASTLFSFLFSMMLLSAFKDSDPGIQITYRTDGGILNIQRLKAKTKVTKSLVRDLLYADGCAIVAHSEDDLQRLTDSLSAATKHFGLTISIKKTKVIFQPSKGSKANMPEIKIDGKVLNNVDSFTYLGSSHSSSNSLDKEISNCIAKASASYRRLHKRVCNERGLKLETKCAVYRAVVLTALLYGCESLTVYRRHVKLLDQFHQRCLRRILNIKWYHRVSNVKVLLQAQMPSIDALLTQSQLRWSGHLVRMQDSRLPKQLFYGELTGGHRPRGRPKLRYKDTLKKSLQKCDIDEKRWEFLATNRSEWRQAIRKGTEAYENKGQVSQVEKRAATKVRLNCAERSIKCPLCSRLCASDFGLRSHMRVHKWIQC